MAAKLTALFLTLANSLTAAVVIFFLLLIAMNGYQETEATWGLGAYLLFAILTVLTASVCAYLTTKALIKRKFTGISSALIAIPVFSILCIGLEIISTIIAVSITEYVRVNY